MRIKNFGIGLILGLLFIILILPAGDITLVRLTETFCPPGPKYFLGTDHLGRDIFSLIKFGLIRTLEVVFVASFTSLFLGLFLGTIAGFYEKHLEEGINFITDLLMVIPSFMLALIFASIFGLHPISCGLLFGVTGMGSYLYQTAALTKKVKGEEFIMAQKVLGFSNMYILKNHILPNILPPIFSTFGSRASNVILAYASLSFVGLGTDLSRPDWGALLYQYRTYTIEHPILIVWPSLGIFLIALGFHLIFDYRGEGFKYSSPKTCKAFSSGGRLSIKAKSKTEKQERLNLRPDKVLAVESLNIEIYDKNGCSPIVNEVSFTVAPGEMIALVGESGSGKTMLVSSLANLLEGNHVNVSGGIFFGDKELNMLSFGRKHRRAISSSNISFIFQDSMNALNPYLKISTQVYEAIKRHKGLKGEKATEYAMKLFEDLGLASDKAALDKYPHEYSGGMRQRVAIAISLVQSPKLIIADEPTTALDTLNKKKLNDFIIDCCKKAGVARIYISHDLGTAAKLCQRILVLKGGRIVEEGLTKTVISAPSHEYTRTLRDAALYLISGFQNVLEEPSYEGRDSSGANINDYIIEAKNLFKSYDKGIVNALKGVTFSLKRGESLGILGESGSGKSTLARCVLRLLNYHEGEIFIDGFDIGKLSADEWKKFQPRVQMIFQNPIASFNPKQKMEAALISAPLYHGIYPDKLTAKNRLYELLEQCGLEKKHLERYPTELSGGQLQRMSIVRSLMMGPELLIADEALSSLDVVVQIQVLLLLKEIVVKHNLSLIFISHDPSLIARLCHDVMVMKEGCIVEKGRSYQIFNCPEELYTKELLEAVPEVDP